VRQYIGLFAVTCDKPLKLEEVSAPEYRRAEEKAGECVFPVAVEGWPAVAFYGVFDRPSSGFPLGIYPLSTVKKVNAGDRLLITFP
jgi:hypothetical protein